MHGRQKVLRSDEEEAKKQKERDKKVFAYQHAMKLIFNKRSKDELDDEILIITGQVLASNPDISTLWNIRKETLIRMKALDEVNFMEKIVPKEFDLTEFCLKANPKSYGAWHHRCWLMKQTDFKRVAEELKTSAKYLEYDDRNFHSWDYRRFLLDNCSLVTVQQELDFTTEKISSNFSNFSSWHLRSKLLPRLTNNYLSEELELIRNAVFTDPKDQSAWLYHLWLLKSQIKDGTPKIVYAERTKMGLIIVFNIRVSESILSDLKVLDSIQEISKTWSNPWMSSRSKIWILNGEKGFENSITIITGKFIEQSFNQNSLEMTIGSRHRNFDSFFDEETKPKSRDFEVLLREELTWVMELRELEPDIKWPVVTAITLMRLINFVEYKPQIMELIEKLLILDPKRTNYYNDLRSKFTIEWILVAFNQSEKDHICLKELNLTALYYPERLCYVKQIDCSNNKLKNCASLSAFLLCQDLDLSYNCIESSTNVIKAIDNLKNLKVLKMSGNPVCNASDFSKFQNLGSSIQVL